MFPRIFLALILCVVFSRAHGEVPHIIKCYPTTSGEIAEVDVRVNGRILGVTHISKKGSTYERMTQYRVYDTSADEGYAWQGIHAKNSSLKIVGRLAVANADGSAIYSEEIIDANKGVVATTEALCPSAIESASKRRPETAPLALAPALQALPTPADSTPPALNKSVTPDTQRADTAEPKSSATTPPQILESRPQTSNSSKPEKDDVSGALFAGALLLILLLALYFLPSIIASSRRHRAIGSIVVINAFLGWTFLGWVLCLAWAFGPNVQPDASPPASI